jgi:hypothetical integral membrane protein (TIGR02206 family)
MNAFLQDNYGFVNYGTEHFVSFILFLLIGILFIVYARKTHKKELADKLHLLFIVFYLIAQITKPLLKLYLGTFDKHDDLPLHLCNLMPAFLLWAFYQPNQRVFKIFSFWILAGSFQSLLTPTLENSFPHFEYFRYWLVHSGITISVFYGFFVKKWRLTIRDGWISLFWLNVFAFTIYFINTLIGSNYFYMNGKPPGTTFYSLLGDWPWYIVQLEFVAILLFGIIVLPFYVQERFTKKIN